MFALTDKDLVFTGSHSGPPSYTLPHTQPNGEVYKINDGEWYRIVITCNGTTDGTMDVIKVYINTVLVGWTMITKVGYVEK